MVYDDMKKTLPTRLWILLLAALFAACAFAAWRIGRPSGARTIAQIAVDGAVVREIDLATVADETRFDVETPYGTNTVLVRPGGICVSDADCPDQVCVRQGWLEGGQVPIVCLPHRLVISLASGGSADALDAVAG